MTICRILLTRSMLPGDLQYIRDGLDQLVHNQYELVVPNVFDEETLCGYAADADVLLGPFVTEKLLQTAEKLKLIQVPWTGMDTFDFGAVQNSSVPICNTHSNSDAVAELAIALMLDLVKKVSYHDRKMRRGSWNRDQTPLTLKSDLIHGKTVCILGLGSIGKRIAVITKAFGTVVYGTSNRCSADETVDRVFRQTEISAAAENADIIICALPLTPDTRSSINREFFAALKKNPFLVNISRAAVIDEAALYEALTDGKGSGFAADVWWNAPKRGESESWPSERYDFQNMDNVVLSPHRAGFINGCLPHLDGAIENIAALILGQPLKNTIDRRKAY